MTAPQPQVHLAISEADFAAWVEKAKPGARIVYHEGYLGADRFPGPTHFAAHQRRELGRVADLALALAEKGLLLLAQRRIDADRVAYLAIKAAKPGLSR
jgi:hypothetical protein